MSDRQVEDLKLQVANLTARLEKLEGENKPAHSKSPAEAMRMILIGPPGAGRLLQTSKERDILTRAQVKERKLLRSRTSIASAIWYVLRNTA